MPTTEEICAWEQKYGPYVIVGGYALLVCVAFYRMIARKPLTTDPFSFISLATFGVLAYAYSFTQDSCPGTQTLGNIVRAFSAGTSSKVPAAALPAYEEISDPKPYVEDAYPGMLAQPGPAAPLSDPRSFYGNMDGLQGKRVAPYKLARGYAHYVPQPI